MKNDLISRQAAIDAMATTIWHYPNECYRNLNEYEFAKGLAEIGLKSVPPVQPEIIHCKDCKFYSPMNRETKTGICNLPMHQNFGDNWFCAGAERRTDEQT